MKTIVVASRNPVKMQAARQGFARMFPGEALSIEAVSAPSGVSDQPFSSAEALQGALNRAAQACILAPAADFWVGIEGGVEAAEETSLAGSELCAFAWVAILSVEQTGKARTGIFFLPPQVAELVHQGKELGEADDIVFGRTNSKQQNGAVGLLTRDALDRVSFYEQAVILALIPFQNPELYPPRG